MPLCTAFDGHTMIAAGPLVQVAAATKAAHEAGRAVLVFRDEDARPVELDLRGDLATVLARGPGFDAAAPVFAEIAADPLLSRRVMIAEPWDTGPGGYQLGAFPD
ncbi:hypothetical protein LTR94_030395, partial [Friedmanniomyces endolithicus]